MKVLDRQAAIQLRVKGHSIKDISQSLKVAKSSVSVWVRDVELSSAQKAPY